MEEAFTHSCESRPDYVGVLRHQDDGWLVTVFDAAQRGYDERCYMGLRLDIPVRFCPFCGEELN